MAYLFDGVNDYISWPTTLNAASAWSFFCWIDADALTTSDYYFTLEASGAASMILWTTSSGGRLRMLMVTSGAQLHREDNVSNILTGAGYQSLAMTYDGSGDGTGITLYVDEVDVGGSTGGTGETPISIDTLVICGRTAGARNLNAKMAEVALYQTELTQSQVSTLHARYSPLSVARGSLVNYCPLIRSRQDLMTGNIGTLGSVPVVSTHPPIIRPTAQILQFPVPAVGGGLSIPVAQHAYRNLRVNA